MLPEPQDVTDELKASKVHEQPAQGEPADESPFGGVEDAALLCFGARVLEQLGVIHASGTGCHAGEATEAEIHFLRKRLGGIEAVVGDGAHQGNSTPRTVPFDLVAS